MSPTRAAALAARAGEGLFVTSYLNPMLALEAAGLPDLATTSREHALLLPEQLSAALRGCTSGSCCPGPAAGPGALGGGADGGCGGVSPAVVPVHVTPLANARSRRRVGDAGAADGCVAGEASGGKLHWNPLWVHDPDASAAWQLLEVEGADV
jgi:hypothetical protein